MVSMGLSRGLVCPPRPLPTLAAAMETAAPDYIDTLTPLVQLADGWLADSLDEADLPDNLQAAARHAVLVGGKRLRPILSILCCEAVGGRRERARRAATSVELIHAFSLVHDDLPALDNDLLRRGQPTVHAKFGEAMAILAGDVLMSLAFQIAASEPDALVRELATATTAMINGQVLDTLGGFDPDSDALTRLNQIHSNKTGALLTAACRMGAGSAGATSEQLAALTRYGEAIGLMFQIVDDLLDVTQSTEHLGKATGKDLDAGKLTFPGVLGVEASREHVRRQHQIAVESLVGLDPTAARKLRELAGYMAVRTR